MNNDLRVFCGGIADAIRTKKGTTDKINAQAFAEEILTIESGGSGDGAVIEYGAVGTVVPNTGYVEKVYFNTALSESEVVGLLSQLTYDSSKMYGVVATNTTGLICVSMDGMYAITNIGFSTIYWVNEAYFNAGGSQMGLTHSGWQDFTNPIEMNGEVLSESGVGEQNDLLTTLFSITPFEKATKTLSGTYDGTSIVADGDVDMATLIDEKKIPLNIKVNKSIRLYNTFSEIIDLTIYPDCQNLINEDGTINTDVEPISISEYGAIDLTASQCLLIRYTYLITNPVNVRYVAIGGYTLLTLTGDNASIGIQKDVL